MITLGKVEGDYKKRKDYAKSRQVGSYDKTQWSQIQRYNRVLTKMSGTTNNGETVDPR